MRNFFSNDSATHEIYTLSLHDALPISQGFDAAGSGVDLTMEIDSESQFAITTLSLASISIVRRSEEHTSELQSHHDLVCRLLLEKKKESDEVELERSRTRESPLRVTFG